MNGALTPIQALVALVGQCELSLDYRPAFRRAIADAHTAILSAAAAPAPKLEEFIELESATSDEAFALSLSELMGRTAPPEIARLFANSELES